MRFENNSIKSAPEQEIYFYRLIKKLYFVFCFLLSALCISCKSRSNIQGKGELFMQGIWNQDSIANKGKLLNYTKHWFKFTCDSFYVDLVTYSKVNYYPEECFNNGVWKEYAKGIYQVRNDSLFLAGDFTKSNHKQKISGCYRSGRYLVSFIIKSATKKQLILENLADERECVLSFKKPVICIQKQL